MRIVHVYKDYAPVVGGIENHIEVVAEAQVRAGDDVTVLVCTPGHVPTRFVRHGVRVVAAGRVATIASTPLSVDLPLRLWALEADVVHLHSPYPLGEAARVMMGVAPFATVVTHHCDVVRQRRLNRLYDPLRRRLLEHADAIIVTHPRALEDGSIPVRARARARVVPLGVDVERFRGAVGGARPPVPRRVLFVGKLRHYKGVDVLLRALVDVPGASLDVVGEGPFAAAWQGEAARLGLQRRVAFVGHLADDALRARYLEAAAFVLPSTSSAEAFGTVLLEAMASGVPCITTELGTGTSWVNQDGETGLVVAARDPGALAGALRRLFDDEPLRLRMGVAARARAESIFALPRLIEGVRRTYELALSRRAARAEDRRA